MDGFVMKGDIYNVCEDLKILAEANKGKTIYEVMQERKAKRLMEKVERQMDEMVKEIEDESKRKKRGF